jgi:uncharacterized protein YxjI
MKLMVKQKVFSLADRFTIYDESGNDKYYAEGELFSWGKKLHITDLGENEVAFVQQKVFSLLPKFYVFQGETQIAEIAKDFTFFIPHYTINGLDWEVEGSFMEHNYSISKDGQTIVTISKEWFTWGDCYVLDIDNCQNEIVALAVVLAIDCVTAAQQTAT